MTTVETVRGGIETSALGTTLMHEHVFVLSPEVFQAAFQRGGTALESGDVAAANDMVNLAGEVVGELHQPSLAWQASFMRTARRILEGALDDAEQSGGDPQVGSACESRCGGVDLLHRADA